jgi:hypothetical protein
VIGIEILVGRSLNIAPSISSFLLAKYEKRGYLSKSATRYEEAVGRYSSRKL